MNTWGRRGLQGPGAGDECGKYDDENDEESGDATKVAGEFAVAFGGGRIEAGLCGAGAKVPVVNAGNDEHGGDKEELLGEDGGVRSLEKAEVEQVVQARAPEPDHVAAGEEQNGQGRPAHGAEAVAEIGEEFAFEVGLEFAGGRDGDHTDEKDATYPGDGGEDVEDDADFVEH